MGKQRSEGNVSNDAAIVVSKEGGKSFRAQGVS